jgi:hypothetical protein
MKRPQPDIGELLKSSFIGHMGNTRKFKRLWGTTYIGGVEVLHNRRYYYPGGSRPSNYEKLFRYLGVYDELVNSNPKGITSAWLYLNKNKGSSLPVDTSGDALPNYMAFVADNLNTMWWDPADGPIPENLALTTSIVIEAEINTTRETTVSTTGILNPSLPFEQLKTLVENNYETLWQTCRITQQGVGVINKGSYQSDVSNVTVVDEDDLSPDDPWLAVIARYALRSNGIPCTIKDISVGYGKNEAGRLYNTYVVDIEIPYKSFTANDAFVSDIAIDIATPNKVITTLNKKLIGTVLSFSNQKITRDLVTAMDSSDLQDDPDLVTRPYTLWENIAVDGDPRFSSIWLNSGGTYYLKADALSNPRQYGIKFKDLGKYLASLVDSGYQKKKKKWYQKALAIAVAVVAVVLSPLTGGLSLNLIGIATFITAVSLTLTLFTLAFTAIGNHEMASIFAEANKTIEPLAMVASIILVVDGIKRAAQKAAEKAALEAGKEVAETSLMDIAESLTKDLVENFVDSIVKGASDFVSGNITAASIKFTEKMVSLLTLPSQLKLESINDRNRDLKAEYEALVQEMTQESDVLKGFMYIYPRPATADWSMYAATFDHPYERGGGPLHIGNIQRTSKQALRKADYNDPIFENILLV